MKRVAITVAMSAVLAALLVSVLAGERPPDRCCSDRAILIEAAKAARQELIWTCGDKCAESISILEKGLLAVGEDRDLKEQAP